MAYIKAILYAIPGIVTLVGLIGDAVKAIKEKADKARQEKWEQNKEAAIRRLENAKTPEEKSKAAKDLQDIISRGA